MTGVTAAPAAGEGCPDENALSELVQGLLDESTSASLEAHLDGCADCRRIVSSVGQSSYVAQRMTRAEPLKGATWGMLEPSNTPTFASHVDPSPLRQPGEILAGKYRIERLLGQGGMGVVMAAKHLTLGKLVAIKLMRADLVVDPNAAQRFVREARAASRLRSEHIVRVIDLDTLDDGAPYMAMEYLEGEDLGALLARRGSISAAEAATCIAQVCEAVAEAHAAGIVHRDLKPANLFVTRRQDGSPCMKVLDFGVSKIIAGGPLADDLTTTDTKALVGSPHYMAPEQLISAKSVDPRTDVWALGCILFQLISGRTPFAATALAEVLASILRDEVPSLDAVQPDVPPGFAAVVARCLDKDPARRFQRVDDLAAALAPFVEGRPTDVIVPVAAPTTTVTTAEAPPTVRVTATAEVRRARASWPRLVAVVLLAIGGVAGYRMMAADDAVPAATPLIVAPPVTPTSAAVPVDAKLAKPALEDDLIDPKF